jgi:hypothetical protein
MAGEDLRSVVGSAVSQAVVELAGHAVEQMASGRVAPVAALASTVVVDASWDGWLAMNAQGIRRPDDRF